MKGTESTLIEFLDGSKKRFIIPVYQRNYDWKLEQCKQLFDDLIKVIRNHRKNHFFGSIVSVYNPDGRNLEFLVIDGQQRLTTVSLLLLAMYNLLSQGKIVSTETPHLAQEIYDDYLVDKHQPNETRMKLKPVKSDKAAFSMLFSDDSEPLVDSNITINYEYFYDRIRRQELSIDELYNAIFKLEIIDIRLNGDDNPQLIFESLNSTGLALSEGDKIRNYILMGLEQPQQVLFYEKYWNRIEICTGYDVSAFIRDYLSVKQMATPSLNRVFFTFREYVEGGAIQTEPLLADMLEYAKLYKTLRVGETESKPLNSCIDRLNRLETTVTRPFFLEVLRLKAGGELSMDALVSVFYIVESYLFRRAICDLPTNALNKIFLTLHKDVTRLDGTTDSYLDKLKYILLSKKERARFPDNEEFGTFITEKQIYLMNSKNKVYLLERLENYGTDEDKNIWDHIDNGDYSVEHIMPQHLTPLWIKSLGQDYASIHETWLHRLANLTLTAYNSKYSNSSFEEKRDMANGFKESGLRMNQRIAQKETWGLAELEERSENLRIRTIEIWAMPETTYMPVEKQLDSCSLDDDMDMTGREIARFSFRNAEQPVTSWVDMYQRVLRILHTDDKSILTHLANIKDDTIELSLQVSYDRTVFRNSVEIGDGIYVLTNTSTSAKMTALKRFFKAYGIDPSELIFYIKDNESPDDTDLDAWHEKRKRYWAYAISKIQNANADTGSFSNVTTSKQNWISGYFGIGGFSICCVANTDTARVELFFGNAGRDFNKSGFDMLYAHRDDIEAAVGVRLVWARGNEIKSSKVYHQIEDVNVENEDDWPRIASFQAEWSHKFILILVPYLQGFTE